MSLFPDHHIEELYNGQLSFKRCKRCDKYERCKFVKINGAEPEYVCRSCLKKMGFGGWYQSKEGVNQALEMANYKKLYDDDDEYKNNPSNKKQRIKHYLPILGLELLGIGILTILAGLSPDIGGEKLNVVTVYSITAGVLIIIEIIHILFPEGERLSSMAKKGFVLKSRLGGGLGVAGNKFSNTVSKGKSMFSDLTNSFKKNEDSSHEEELDDSQTSINALLRNKNAGSDSNDNSSRLQVVDIMGDVIEPGGNITDILCETCNAYMLRVDKQSDRIRCPLCGYVDFMSNHQK